MIASPAAVEDDLFDPFAESGLGGEGADGFSAGSVGGQLIAIGSCFADAGGGSEGNAGIIVDELDVNVFISKAHAHARAVFSATDFFADAPAAADGEAVFDFGSHEKSDKGLLDGFAFLTDDPFVAVADAFAFVRFRGVKAADFGGDLADDLAVGSLDGEFGIFLDRYFDLI